MLADLHLHTQCSDGTMTPREMALAGAKLGYGLLALADHNTGAGWGEFSAACRELSIIPLRGMELDCLYDRWEIHMLAYGYTPTPALETLAARNTRLMLDMSDDLIKKLLPRFPSLSWEEWQAHPHDHTRGGWKGLHYLFDKGLTGTLEEGMSFYTRYGCDYRDYPFPTAEEVCRVVREAGGIPVLAHPSNWFADLSPDELLAHLDALRQLGIGGVECHYPANSPRMTSLCRDFCQRHGLLITAGSDWHGDFCTSLRGVAYTLGAVAVPVEELDLGNLLEKGWVL